MVNCIGDGNNGKVTLIIMPHKYALFYSNITKNAKYVHENIFY